MCNRKELNTSRELRVHRDAPDDNLFLVEVAHLHRYPLKQPRQSHFSVSYNGQYGERLLFERAQGDLVAVGTFALHCFDIDIFFFMRVAHHEHPLVTHSRCVHDRDHGARGGRHERGFVCFQLITYPLLRTVVLPCQCADRRVVKTKLRPKLLSDPGEEVFLLGYLKLSAAPKAFVSLYASKKSILRL